jgi:hypothetical protein
MRQVISLRLIRLSRSRSAADREAQRMAMKKVPKSIRLGDLEALASKEKLAYRGFIVIVGPGRACKEIGIA